MGAKLRFYFQPPFSGWMPTTIYQNLFNHYLSIYGDAVVADNTSISYNNNYGHRDGPHHLIIENEQTKHYKVVTYWDRACELLNDNCEWDNSKCLGIYSAVDAKSYDGIIPSSYCVYHQEIEKTINSINTDFQKKIYDNLIFRGFLYSSRFLLDSIANSSSKTLKIHSDRLSYVDYTNEINAHKIGLSLDGAAEICNRDIEILGVGSVLLRPKLISTGFHNPLIPEFHYVSFETSNDPKAQLEIITEKHRMLLKDIDYMIYVAMNGRDWYNVNGSCRGNVQVLSEILNIEELMNI